MATERHQKLVKWMKKRKVATMKAMRHQFQLSHMTVFRILKEYGYYTSYNYNATYYALHDVPQFDPLGLWAYPHQGLPQGCSPSEVIEILRQMVLSPQADPDQLAQELSGRDVQATIRQVRRVIDHYALKKKRRR